MSKTHATNEGLKQYGIDDSTFMTNELDHIMEVAYFTLHLNGNTDEITVGQVDGTEEFLDTKPIPDHLPRLKRIDDALREHHAQLVYEHSNTFEDPEGSYYIAYIAYGNLIDKWQDLISEERERQWSRPYYVPYELAFAHDFIEAHANDTDLVMVAVGVY